MSRIIDVNNVYKAFGTHRVLSGVSLYVDEGETLVILGRSGTGKSVLLKCIIGLMDPDQGQIEVMGKNLNALPEHHRLPLRRKLGYVFQGAALFDSMTVRENVGFALDQERRADAEVRGKVERRLGMVGLGHAIDQFPSELSGGMQKRVGLARALIDDPQIILYDEPTTGLDPLTTDVINQIILRLRNQLKVTSVVVTHDIKSAFTIADRIVMLDGGHVVCTGTPAEIEANTNPWVQHFIHGRALENEVVEGNITGRFNVPGGDSGIRPVIRRDEVGSESGASKGPSSGPRNRLPTAIRHRPREGTDSGDQALERKREEAQEREP